MLPEDRLDSLLTLQLAHDGAEPESGDETLTPLLDAAGRLGALGTADPSLEFSLRLERLFLAQADSQLEYGSNVPQPLAYDATPIPLADEPPRLGNDFPTLPGIPWDATPTEATEAEATTGTTISGQPIAIFRRPLLRRALWTAIAAALLLTLGATTLTAAASAGPGSPLYRLHRWEQNVRVTLSGSAADRTALHLQYARDALAALNATVAQRQFGAPYDDALATYHDEMAAAGANLADVPSGGQHDGLASQLQQLRATGRSDLHAALAALPWAERLSTTTVLASIDDHVLSVAQATMIYSGHGQHLWQIIVSGSGFQQGARLLVNDEPAGNVTSVTATTLVATLSGDDSAPLPATIGVANSDGTAAVTSLISSNEQQESPTTAPQVSPTVDDHGGDHHGGGSNSGPGGGSSTPGDGGH